VLAFEPVVAGTLSIAMGQESLSSSLLLGGALVVLGVMVATARRASPEPASRAGE
jgi:drug/metabolite transporter (DMT)-like permease